MQKHRYRRANSSAERGTDARHPRRPRRPSRERARVRSERQQRLGPPTAPSHLTNTGERSWTTQWRGLQHRRSTDLSEDLAGYLLRHLGAGLGFRGVRTGGTEDSVDGGGHQAQQGCDAAGPHRRRSRTLTIRRPVWVGVRANSGADECCWSAGSPQARRSWPRRPSRSSWCRWGNWPRGRVALRRLGDLRSGHVSPRNG